jgi:hypothetical protein
MTHKSVTIARKTAKGLGPPERQQIVPICEIALR